MTTLARERRASYPDNHAAAVWRVAVGEVAAHLYRENLQQAAADELGVSKRTLNRRLDLGDDLSLADFDRLCALTGVDPVDMLTYGEAFVTTSEKYRAPAPESAVNVVRIVIDVINERDGSALTFEQVARDCGIEPVGARMPDLYTMNEHLVDRYAR